MSNVTTAPVSKAATTRRGLVRWYRSKDPDLLVLKRSVRAAVVMPAVFAVGHELFSNPQVGLFGAFGSFALLLLVEFSGPVRSRLLSYCGLFLVGAVFIVIATTVSTHKAAAVIAMGVVGFLVLYAGIVSPQVATASTAALLTFVLPVAVAGPVSDIGPRLFGWALAGVGCIAACLFVWPPPWHDNLRRRLSSAVAAVARLADARARGEPDPEAQADVATELDHLRQQFSATPYPPTGAASGAVALSKLVGRIEWVAGNQAMIGDAHWSAQPQQARHVTASVADTLFATAALICDGDAHPVTDRRHIEAVEKSARHLDQQISTALAADVTAVNHLTADSAAPEADPSGEPALSTDADDDIAGDLDPGFHARAVGIATVLVADAALEAAGAQPVAREHRLAMLEQSTPQLYAHRLLSHLSFHSVWFRNAVRGAAGLALAVLAVELLAGVQHGFWVVLGMLSVLRSNALGTGSTAIRAIGGTAVGFVVGSLIMVGLADHTGLLWAVLPLAALVSGIAPTLISFAAGQAAFTVFVIILFNLLQPVGWKVGLTRIEDVALGCAVSVVVGFLFWPRGATAALGRALSNAFAASSGYLADAVERLTLTRQHVETESSATASHNAYQLLDDAFRQFVAERGAKVVSMDTIAGLFTGSNRLRIAAYTLDTLTVYPPADGQSELESVAVAESVLRDSYALSHRWYEGFADLLAGRRETLEQPVEHDEVLHDVLRQAFEEVASEHRGDRLQTTLQMLWADEVLENQAAMQADLLASADLFVRRKRQALI